MSGLVGFLAALIFAPRLIIFVIWLCSNWFSQAFAGWGWPLLGFIFMPWTTLCWAAAVNDLGMEQDFTTGWTILMILAILADLAGGEGCRD